MSKRVSDYIPERVAYSQLAEECVELAHAALKLSRFADPDQIKTVGAAHEDEVIRNVIEEIGDVLCCLDVLMEFSRIGGVVMIDDAITEAQEMKYQRWLGRLENAEGN